MQNKLSHIHGFDLGKLTLAIDRDLVVRYVTLAANPDRLTLEQVDEAIAALQRLRSQLR